jgi:hypothetical protein
MAINMSPDAEDSMRVITQEYVNKGFPNHKVWFLRHPPRDKTFPELRILGFIELAASGGLYRLTDHGKDWVMDNRP